MRHLAMITIFLLAVGLALPAGVSAQTYGDPAAGEADQGMGQGVDQGMGTETSAMAINGTVTSLDQAANTITVSDQSTGAERTFTADAGQLQDIQQGDQVMVTPQSDDPNRIESIEKQDQTL